MGLELQPSAAVTPPVPAARRSWAHICRGPGRAAGPGAGYQAFSKALSFQHEFPVTVTLRFYQLTLLSALPSTSYSLSLDLMFVFWSSFSGP